MTRRERPPALLVTADGTVFAGEAAGATAADVPAAICPPVVASVASAS